MHIPESVVAAQDRASRSGFELSSEPEVGHLMACLANAIPVGGRILEIGTGCGVGLSWIVHGLGSRADVEVVSVEIDSAIAASTRSVGWPDWVSIPPGMLLPTDHYLIGVADVLDSGTHTLEVRPDFFRVALVANPAPLLLNASRLIITTGPSLSFAVSMTSESCCLVGSM